MAAPPPDLLSSNRTGDLPRVAIALLADELAELAIATTNPGTRRRLLQALALLEPAEATALADAQSAGTDTGTGCIECDRLRTELERIRAELADSEIWAPVYPCHWHSDEPTPCRLCARKGDQGGG